MQHHQHHFHHVSNNRTTKWNNNKTVHKARKCEETLEQKNTEIWSDNNKNKELTSFSSCMSINKPFTNTAAMIILLTTITSWFIDSRIILPALFMVQFVSSQTVYNGPATNVYFSEKYNESISNLRELSCDISSYYDITSATSPVIYYRFNLTSSMKEFYTTITVSTCCESSAISSYCDTESLDTNLYILYEKKGQINLIQTSDDLSKTVCNDTRKSNINLIEYAAGEYVIGVGGYGKEYGKFYVELHCLTDSSYSGPATIDWFRENFDSSLIEELPELSCYTFFSMNNITNATIAEAWSRNSHYIGATTPTHLVNYYKLNLTEHIKKTFVETLFVSTCCEFELCHVAYDSEDWCHQYMFENSVFLTYWYSMEYEPFCGDYSLDTYLYVLQEQKGHLMLIDSIDDVGEDTCSNKKKSYIDLSALDEGLYIIAVGGFVKSNGPYYLFLDCTQYSYPMREDQFDPLNSTDLQCNTTLTNEANTPTKHVSYYNFNITSNLYPPISISMCETNDQYILINLFKLIDNKYQLIGEKNGYGCTESVSDDVVFDDVNISKTNIGSYYLVAQGVWNLPINFQVNMTCGVPPTPDPTNNPTMEPTEYPTNAPTFNPSPSPTFEYSFPIKKSEFTILDSHKTIGCGETLFNQVNTDENLVTYYQFSITDKAYPPIVISTCPPNVINRSIYQYDTYLYIIQDYGKDVVILHQTDVAGCNDKSAEIDVSSLDNGEYYVVVQGYGNEIGNFTITMQCEEP
eukprot:309527_1